LHYSAAAANFDGILNDCASQLIGRKIRLGWTEAAKRVDIALFGFASIVDRIENPESDLDGSMAEV
jgi:hypothetical protein